MKFLIAGLGNIGPTYDKTRHNAGFIVLDTLAKRHGQEFQTKRLGDLASLRLKNKSLVLLKPGTFMNLSGKAVNYWLMDNGLGPENLLVVTDDLSLPEGQIRLKGKGSSGGHNGLAHIESTLGTQEYARLRVGIGNHYGRGQQVDYVLGRWSDNELANLAPAFERAADAVECFALEGLVRAMNTYNKPIP
ncbi:MAG: aminoacyl-tRNA hydrolase [Bacteroidetes bacterium]|jgi:PTH1 family peptidyl-tRNA hydrolase|nr:aminoacyl-tRNA hydrolase [Bacteroidota bacterium]